jgi:hypothetical protein
MIKKTVLSAAAITLLASGMAFANTLSDLPGSRVAANQNGRDSVVNPTLKLPGVVGTQETPTAGTGTIGEAPATGVQSGERGSAFADSDSLPGTEAVVATNTSTRIVAGS